jgi:hypothetical protein
MKLDIFVSGRKHTLDIPPEVLRDAEAFFRKMDADMDRGWQMGADFIERPDRLQRCQIAATRLLNALMTERQGSVLLMAGYILTRLPGVTGVHIDTTGDMTQTEFIYDSPREPQAPAAAVATDPLPSAAAPSHTSASLPPGNRPLGKLEALTRAGQEVSKVYRAGRGYRFAVLDHASGQWMESVLFENEREANEARLLAVRRRYEELLGAAPPGVGEREGVRRES